jgi:hypothetical protein
MIALDCKEKVEEKIAFVINSGCVVNATGIWISPRCLKSPWWSPTISAHEVTTLENPDFRLISG